MVYLTIQLVMEYILLLKRLFIEFTIFCFVLCSNLFLFQ